MDKFFIQAAFKSLDEIDLEENKQIKQALIESRLKEKALRERKKKKYPLAKGEHLNTCAGNPDINTAAFNHATDVGASSPSTGLGEDIEGLKPLDEKLPKDLAKAYKNSDASLYANRLSVNKQQPSEQDKHNIAVQLQDYKETNLSPIDFENASYQEITKNEAMKYATPKKCWQLVLVFGQNNPRAIRFDKNGKALNSFDLEWKDRYRSTVDGRETLRTTQIPLRELIRRATKIYLTDEQDHLNDNYFENNKSEPATTKNNIVSANLLNTGLTTAYNRENNVYSRNDSYAKEQWEYDELRKKLIRNERYIEDCLKRLKALPKDSSGYAQSKNDLDYYYEQKRKIQKKMRLLRSLMSKQILPSEYLERREILDTPDPSDRMTGYNLRLREIEILKNQLKSKIKTFNEKSDTYLKGNSYKDNWEYKYYTEKIKNLEAQIKEAQDLIAQYNTKLSEIDKAAIDDKIADELNASYDLIKQLNSSLTALGAKSMIKEDVEKNKFNLNDPEDVKQAIERKDHPEKEDELVIIHPLLNHKKPSPGNAILTCKDCNEVFYFDKNELKQDEEDPSIYNKDIQCENCGANDGYDYVGDVSLKDTESAKEAEKERKDIEQDDFVDEEPEEQTKEPELETIDDLEEPEEIVEESFDKLANKYFNKIYENISSYKTTGISQEDRNKYIIEGVLTDKNKKEEKISFLLETLKRNKDKVVLQGSLKELIENKAPFRFCGKITDNKLLFESMRYRYVENIDKDRYLVEGLEINR